MNQIFSLGYILLIAALGGNKLDCFDKLDNINSYQDIINKDLDPCCLFHLLLSTDSNKKFSIKSFLKKSKYSDSFFDFLCQTMSLKQKNYNSAKLLMNHTWIKQATLIKGNIIKVSLQELIKITKESRKINITSFNEKKFNNFINNYEIILSNNREISNEELLKLIQIQRKDLKEISIDLGVNLNELIQHMQSKILSRN
jgi:hypothetical protein